jgi:hypothetical protein
VKILFVGDYVEQPQEGRTGRMRMVALRDLGHGIVPLDTKPSWAIKKERAVSARVLWKLGFPVDGFGLSRKLPGIVAKEAPGVVWLEKNLALRPGALRRIRARNPEVRIVSYCADDMGSRHHHSHYYLQCLPLYDVSFVTRPFNVGELLALGARKVICVLNGCDLSTHRPMPVSDGDRLRLGGPVGFIGGFERERAESMLALAEAGIPVRIWGSDWWRWGRGHPLLQIEGRPIFAEDYVKGLCSFDIALVFVRRRNRDRHVQRSFEVPACGVFMLAERTEQHLELFEEGKEAEFFGSDDELIEKARFYLGHPDLRQKIARAGRERVLRSGYDYQSQMKWMMERVCEIPER